MKNTTKNIGKLALAALLGSFLWAGCASTPNQPAEQPGLETTVDLNEIGPSVTPQFSTGLYDPFQSEWSVESIE
ncbi:MAG TPA: hypothetical protein VH619_00220 [Verrucomicrobiae bacterium]|jgi:hypothetical protein|nr:hypothetical protein [Verrucomicrobiae bacterium]